MIMMRMIKVIQPLVDETLNPLIRQAPVLESCYNFSKTANRVYNATSPSQAITCAVKGIV